jgi:hypothetical protein
LKRLGRDAEDAKKRILDFLGWQTPDEELFDGDVRIVLASANLSKEVTTTVMWLNEHDLDIRCVRLKPYRLEGRLLLDVQQILPPPEAREYQVQLRTKATERRPSRREGGGPDFTRYDLACAGQQLARQWKRNMIYAIARAAVEQNIPPLDLPIPRGKWLVVASECASATAFEERLAQEPDAGTRAWGPKRWFCDEGEFLNHGGRTYCLSNLWGDQVLPIIDDIKAKYPQLGISYERSVTTDGEDVPGSE